MDDQEYEKTKRWLKIQALDAYKMLKAAQGGPTDYITHALTTGKPESLRAGV